MVDERLKEPEELDSRTRILLVLEDVTSRRLAGETIGDEEIVAFHSDLMPELGERLFDLRAVERARQIASDSSPRGQAGRAHEERPYHPELELPPPDTFNGYEIIEEIGRGAMGVVYRALQVSTQREVAIKVMFEGPFVGPQERSRFEREARVLARLKHPNVVTIYDTGVANGHFFIVMDYIDGTALDAHLAGRKLSVADQLDLFVKVCDAVGAAHVRGVIHRDLKPSNLRVDTEGEPHVLDFGLAKTVSDDGMEFARSMTMTGQFVGSLPWASPEQAEGDPAGIDVRSDVYALGVILYQILTGRFPYPVVGHLRDVINNILTSDPVRPRTLAREVDDDVETIVLKCLAKEPQRRYQSAVELARDIRHYLAGEPIEAKRDSTWYMLAKSLRRHRATVGVAAAFVVLLAAFGITMSVMYARAQHEADRAQRSLTFLQETLFEASSQRLGADVKLLDVIEAAAVRLEKEFVDQPETAAALHYTIGHAYDTVWRQRDAKTHLQKALQLYTETHGRDHPEAVRCMVLLGMVMAELRDPQSVVLQEEALAIRRKRYGDEHVLTAESRSELAYALWRAAIPRQWSRAEQYYHDALFYYRRALGNEHPDIARCLHIFAAMYQALGRYEKAEPLFRESLVMSRRLLGSSHQFVAECMLDYSVVLQALKRFDAAETLLRELLTLAPKQFGRTALPMVMRRMGSLHLTRGDLASAEDWMVRALEADLRHAAEEHPEQVERLMQWAAKVGLSSPGRPLTATEYRDAFSALIQLMDNPSETVEAMLDLAIVWLADGSPRPTADALPLLSESVTVLENTPEATSIFLGYAKSLLGECLTRLGDYEKAEAHLLEAHAGLKGVLGDEHRVTVESVERLARLYERWGKPDRARTYHAMLPGETD